MVDYEQNFYIIVDTFVFVLIWIALWSLFDMLVTEMKWKKKGQLIFYVFLLVVSIFILLFAGSALNSRAYPA